MKAEPTFYQNDNFCYLMIPKSASTSIRKVICGDREKRSYVPITKEVFTVFRNPINRCYSAYHELLKNQKYKGGFNSRVTSFDAYIKECQNGFWDRHQLPQSDYKDAFYSRYDQPLKIFSVDSVQTYLNTLLPVMNKGKGYKYGYEYLIVEMYMEDQYIWENL